MHTVPLWILTYQNHDNDIVEQTSISRAALAFPIISLFLIALEVCTLQLFDNCKVNLEMRVRLRSTIRLRDMFRVSSLSILMTMGSVLIGLYGFAKQGCVSDFFEENSICKSCRSFVNPYCSQCEDRTACTGCDKGFYPIDTECIDCKLTD